MSARGAGPAASSRARGVRRGIALALLGWLCAAPLAAQGAEYVGSQRCAACHSGQSRDNPYITWLSSRHALAYWRLATDWARFLASIREEYKDIENPIEEQRCLKCHHAGGQDEEARFAASFDKQEGVGCEACHGAGSDYAVDEIMRDREQFLKHGGVVPDERTCRSCHRDDRFDYATWLAKVAHSVPAREIEPEHP